MAGRGGGDGGGGVTGMIKVIAAAIKGEKEWVEGGKED